MKKTIILAIMTIASSASVTGQNKVYWVHGLGDKETTWDVYKSALIEEKNQGTSITWSQSSSLQGASNVLNGTINREVPASKKAIVFGHSAGGLVARNAARSNTRIRAIITAGTPNHGAGIVTSLHNRSFNNVATSAINKVRTSFSLSTLAVGSVLPGIGGTILHAITGAVNVAANVGIALANDAIDEMKVAYATVAANNMDPNLANNSFLKTLNSTAPKVPVINLYGNEDDNRLVRIAGTALNKDENDSASNTNDACYDQTAFPYYNAALGTCTTLEVLHYATGTAMAVAGIWYPAYWASSALNYSAAAAWTDTRRFVQFDVHNEWDRIIGATHVDRIENWRRFLWWKWCDVSYVTVYENSDGFIPNKSSIMDESKGPRTRNYEIKGVNHLEMNSHPEMRTRLNSIYRGNYGNEFDPARD